MLAKLFSFRQPVSSMIAKYVDALGMDKIQAPEKSLDDYIRETYGDRGENDAQAARDVPETTNSADEGDKEPRP